MNNLELASSLRSAVSLMNKKLRQTIKSIDSLSLTEITSLSHLYQKGELFPSELAALAMIKAQSMSQAINRLNDMELIIKTPSETDKRKVAISLSDAGKQVVERARYERHEWLDKTIEECYTAEEKKILQQAVNLMGRLIDYK